MSAGVGVLYSRTSLPRETKINITYLNRHLTTFGRKTRTLYYYNLQIEKGGGKEIEERKEKLKEIKSSAASRHRKYEQLIVFTRNSTYVCVMRVGQGYNSPTPLMRQSIVIYLIRFDRCLGLSPRSTESVNEKPRSLLISVVVALLSHTRSCSSKLKDHKPLGSLSRCSNT